MGSNCSDWCKRKSSFTHVRESRLNQYLQSGWRASCSKRKPLSLVHRPLNTHADLLQTWYCRIHVCTAAAFLVFLHIANNFFHAHYKRITLQKPPGTAASSQQWRTSNWALGWPQPDRSTNHPLSCLDQTSWCWDRNMRTSSLDILAFSKSNKALSLGWLHDCQQHITAYRPPAQAMYLCVMYNSADRLLPRSKRVVYLYLSNTV